MQNKNSNKEQYAANRKKIIVLSQQARLLMEMEEAGSVNEGLIMIYEQNNEGANEFNTFAQWKDKGYVIKKGSKAFLVWGQPRQVSQTPEGATEPEEYKYWPICYLFANTQVHKPVKEDKPAKVTQQPEPAAVLEMDAIL